MWDKAAVQRNFQRLTEDGVHFVGPASGWLSCRKMGLGRLAEPDEILAAIDKVLLG
jgi:phosphopantothenoylcysteine decarboxylase/phosphopantothenate--cysteine ligase